MNPGQRYYRCVGNSSIALELSYAGAFTCPNNVSVTNTESNTTTYHCRTKRSTFNHQPKYTPSCLLYFDKNKENNSNAVVNMSNKARTAQRLKIGTRMR